MDDIPADLNMCPGPGLVWRWQDADGLREQPNHREEPGEGRNLLKLTVFQHQQENPWSQPGVISCCGCIPPGEVFLVEFEEGKIVGLEIGDIVARLGTDDSPWADPDHIPRSDELNIFRNEWGILAHT